MADRPRFSWRSRYPQHCVSLVDDVAEVEVVRRFGADAERITVRDSRQTALMYDEANGYRPVVKAVRRGSWTVAFEQESVEGVRPEVLRRLSVDSRVLSFASTGDGVSLLGYAEDGVVVAAFEPSEDDLVVLARRIGLELGGRGNGPADLLLELANAVCGFPISDEVVEASGPAAVVLPVLPDPPTAPLAVVTGSDARLSALLRCVTRDRLGPSVLAQARRLAVDAGLGVHADLMRALEEEPADRVPDESPLGLLLRTLIADARSVPLSATLEQAKVIRSRGDVALALNAVLAGTPHLAVAELARRRLGTGWRERLLADLADIEIPDEVLREEQDKVIRLRRVSVPVDPSASSARHRASGDRPAHGEQD